MLQLLMIVIHYSYIMGSSHDWDHRTPAGKEFCFVLIFLEERFVLVTLALLSDYKCDYTASKTFFQLTKVTQLTCLRMPLVSVTSFHRRDEFRRVQKKNPFFITMENPRKKILVLKDILRFRNRCTAQSRN